MDDLISREVAIDGLLAFCPERTEPGSLDEYGASVLYGVIDVVLKQLPAVDAVPVVRCRDCVYGCLSKNVRGEDRVFCENPDFEGMDYLVNELDWYCADGERRDEDADNRC